ncbi:Transmembrane BAX inhibitor motif-containing protein 4 [Mucor circinelloides]
MTFNHNPNRLSLPTEITRTVSNASFYGSLSIHQRFDRLGSGQDLDLFGTSVARSSVSSQMKFIRKVYLITLAQLLMISSMITLFLHFTYWHEESQYVWWVVLFPASIMLIVAAWQLWTQYYQLSRTSRFIILVVYSFLMAFILSDIVSKVFQEYGLLVFTMTCLGIVSIVMYTFQTKFKFQGTKPIFCSIASVCMSSVGLRIVYQLNPVQILGPIAVSSIICSYLILELYYAMDTMTVDDYVLANMSFHMDLVYPINGLHHLCELSDDVDNFPEYFNPDASPVLNSA